MRFPIGPIIPHAIRSVTVDSYGNANLDGLNYADAYVRAFKLTATASGTLKLLGINMKAVAGSVRLGLYSHDAVNNKPASLLAETASTVLVDVGPNFIIPTSFPRIIVGTIYWPAFRVNNNGADIFYKNVAIRVSYYVKAYGAFDASWSAGSTETNNIAGNNLLVVYG